MCVIGIEIDLWCCVCVSRDDDYGRKVEELCYEGKTVSFVLSFTNHMRDPKRKISTHLISKYPSAFADYGATQSRCERSS